MKSTLLLLGTMLRDFFLSTKVLAAILTAILEVTVKDPATRLHLLGVGVSLITAMGITDHGKAKAKIEAASKIDVAVTQAKIAGGTFGSGLRTIPPLAPLVSTPASPTGP